MGSSLPVESPGAPLLVEEGSEPLSESSLAVIGWFDESRIGFPALSTASPPVVTWLSSGDEVPLASGSTSTSKRTVNESPTAREVLAA